MRMRRLGVVVAFDRVGHRLAHGMAGLNATQETASVIWRFRADKRDQFRVHWNDTVFNYYFARIR